MITAPELLGLALFSHFIVFIIGFVWGGSLVQGSTKRDVERGWIEIGQKLYKVTETTP